MSLRAKLPDRELVDTVLEFAASSWEPAALASWWDRHGWAWSRDHDGLAVSRLFLLRPSDPDLTGGRPGGAFFLDFCAFMTPDDDPDGDELADEWDGPNWPLRRDAGRAEFDKVCLDAIGLVTDALGVPGYRGRDDDAEQPWLYALWRLKDADRMVIVAQRDDLDLELGSLWLRDAPAGTPLPDPDEPFVDWLYR